MVRKYGKPPSSKDVLPAAVLDFLDEYKEIPLEGDQCYKQ